MKHICDLYSDFWKNPRYDKMYIVVDIHNTIVRPTFERSENFDYFPWAKQCLQELSSDPNIVLILWSGCYPDKFEMYLKHFEENGIHFDYVNENPECKNSSYACFDQKMYFDIGIDDRFGFEANIDWANLYPIIIKNKINKYDSL
jgi:hypothetical protein